jgi:CDP-6-deoxy-D-xylo-4-hexulose-3-dehydrase
LSYVFLVHPEAGFGRSELQQFLEPRGVDTRTVWTGNATRCEASTPSATTPPA